MTSSDTNAVNFSRALEHIKLGNKVFRKGWNGKGAWVALMHGDEESELHPPGWLPYIYMKTAKAEYVPWLASQTDLLAEDWILIH
jgi:hypothetical protein